MVLFRMTSITFRLAVVAAMALGLSLCPIIAAAAEAEQYPIWWSPALELESLDKIDERLRRRLWPGDEYGLPMFRILTGKKIRIEVENCVSLERRLAERYEGVGNNNHKLSVYHTAWCGAVRMLQDAKPAKVGYLRNFVMDADSVDYLPALLNIFDSCQGICRRYRANEEGIPLGRFEPDFDVEVVSRHEIKGWSDDETFSVEIVGRADFDGDTVDDLLVIAGAAATKGTAGGTRLFLLSQESSDAILRVLDAEQHLCPNFLCEYQSE